jgi:hypothetical protein
MHQVPIPDAVFREIQRVLPKSVTADEFVLEAIRERLSVEDRKNEFYGLSERTRRAMAEKGLMESDILAEFESTRQARSG